MSEFQFKIGDKVVKKDGYRWPGEIVSVFNKRDDKPLVVVECTAEAVEGACRIFAPEDLRLQPTGLDHAPEASKQPYIPTTPHSYSIELFSFAHRQMIYDAMREPSEVWIRDGARPAEYPQHFAYFIPLPNGGIFGVYGVWRDRSSTLKVEGFALSSEAVYVRAQINTYLEKPKLIWSK
jgi:hypothetical protein